MMGGMLFQFYRTAANSEHFQQFGLMYL